jgi:hypothetical protein
MVPDPRQWVRVRAVASPAAQPAVDTRRHPVKTRTLIIAAILTGAAILAAGITQIVLGRAGH